MPAKSDHGPGGARVDIDRRNAVSVPSHAMAHAPAAIGTLARRLLPLALASAVVATGCAPPSATTSARLTDVEEEYADALGHAYAVARSVPMDVDEIVEQNIDHTLNGETDSSNIVRTLQEAQQVLASMAAELRQPAPYTMDSLAEGNERAAKVLEEAYASCIDVVLKETTESWGKDALSGLFGVGGGADSVAAKARILSCVGSEGQKVRDAVDAGMGALRAKQDEILSGRSQAPENGCFIATAAYGTASATQIDVLRDFRDDVLLQSAAGRDYIGFYYAASPPLAQYIAEREWLRTLVRQWLVEPAVAGCQALRRFGPDD